jgi:hypothetical protein
LGASYRTKGWFATKKLLKNPLHANSLINKSFVLKINLRNPSYFLVLMQIFYTPHAYYPGNKDGGGELI